MADAVSAADLRKLLLAKRLVIGATSTLSGIRNNTIARVIVANNCDRKILKSLEQYSKISGFEIVRLDMPAEEIGVMCKKQFGISVLGILK